MWACRRRLWWAEPRPVYKVEPKDLLMLWMWTDRGRQGEVARMTPGSWPELVSECITLSKS